MTIRGIIASIMWINGFEDLSTAALHVFIIITFARFHIPF